MIAVNSKKGVSGWKDRPLKLLKVYKIVKR